MTRLKAHPFAEMLPLLSKEEKQVLRNDIEANGLCEPVVLYQGKILDGRHRAEICYELGKEFKPVNFAGDDAAALNFVYSKSLHRNMDESRKAIAALKLLPHFQKHGRFNDDGTAASVQRIPKGRSAALAASIYNVSERYVNYAVKLQKLDPKAVEETFNGTKKLTQVLREVNNNIATEALKKKAASAPRVGSYSNRIGDCVEGLALLPARKVKLIFADPPYNNGFPYDGHGSEKSDHLPREKYLAHVASWVAECHRVLTDDGSIFVMIDDEYACEFGLILREKGFHRRAWIKWHETFGVYDQNNFGHWTRHIFYCVKDPDQFTFHRSAFLVDSERIKIGDARADKAGKIIDDMWTIARMPGNHGERVRMPLGKPTPGKAAKSFCQLPLELVSPIVLGCSNPGDIVCDPFTGSGTTAEAACTNGRQYIGFEKRARFARVAERRVRVAVAKANQKGKS